MEEEGNYLSSGSESRGLLAPRQRSPTGDSIASHHGPEKRLRNAKKLALRWEAKYQEAAIFLQEGFENDSFASHPRDDSSRQAYRFVHSPAFHILDVFAAILLMALALVEEPAVDKLQMPLQGHALVELLLLVVLAMDLLMRMRWLKWKRIIRHKRIILKTVFLIIMVAEAVTVAVREKTHFRITRALRPLFLLDSYYCMGARRVARQIVQSLPPILDMIILLLFVMLIFSIFGYFLFSQNKADPNFHTFKDSFVSLFVLVTTANYPDVMMPAYNHYVWAPAFFVIYLSLTLYILLNLLTAVVYSTFQEFEKRKFRKLLLHKREAVNRMFRLLCSNRRTTLPFIHFRGVMRYYKPSVDDTSCRCVFKALNVTGSGRLTLDECQAIYEAILLRWTRVNDEMQEEAWFSRLPGMLRTIVSGVKKIVEHKIFHHFITLTLIANGLFMLVDAAISKGGEPDQDPTPGLVFTIVYTIEAALKITGLGPRQYFRHPWNVFDFVIVITSLSGLLAETSHLRVFVVLRPLRLLRLFELKKRYKDVLGTLFVLLPRFANVGLLLVVFFYFFAIVGMEAFQGKVSPGCCLNSPVASYYSAGNDTVYYYLNSFDNVLKSYVTLFELMVVNNWFVIMDGFVSETTEWARLYFMLFYLMSLMVVNIVVAFILDAFLFRIASQQSDNASALEGEQSSIEVTLSPDEVSGANAVPLQLLAAPAEIRFTGRRRRTKLDLSLMMYRDEIKEWYREADIAEQEEVAGAGQQDDVSMSTLSKVSSVETSETPAAAASSSPLALYDTPSLAGKRRSMSQQTSLVELGAGPTVIDINTDQRDIAGEHQRTQVHLSHSSLHYDAVSSNSDIPTDLETQQQQTPSSLPAHGQSRPNSGSFTPGSGAGGPESRRRRFASQRSSSSLNTRSMDSSVRDIVHQEVDNDFNNFAAQRYSLQVSDASQPANRLGKQGLASVSATNIAASSPAGPFLRRQVRSELSSPQRQDSGHPSPKPSKLSDSNLDRQYGHSLDFQKVSSSLSTFKASHPSQPQDTLLVPQSASNSRDEVNQWTRPTTSVMTTLVAEDTDDELIA